MNEIILICTSIITGYGIAEWRWRSQRLSLKGRTTTAEERLQYWKDRCDMYQKSSEKASREAQEWKAIADDKNKKLLNIRNALGKKPAVKDEGSQR